MFLWSTKLFGLKSNSKTHSNIYLYPSFLNSSHLFGSFVNDQLIEFLASVSRSLSRQQTFVSPKFSLLTPESLEIWVKYWVWKYHWFPEYIVSFDSAKSYKLQHFYLPAASWIISPSNSSFPHIFLQNDNVQIGYPFPRRMKFETI